MSASRLGISLVCVASLSAIACNKGGGATKEDLALVPKETELVVGVNFARLRGTAMWKKFMDLANSQEKSKKDFEDFNKNCVDISSAEGPETLFVAIPEVSKQTKDGAVIVRLKTAIDEAKATKCAEYMATKNGEKLVTTDYNGKKIWNTDKPGDNDKGGVTLVDGKTLAFGSGAWIKKVIDLSSGKETASAKENVALVALIKRTKTTDGIWGAGTVPQAARDSFKGTPQLAPMASLKAVFGSIDFATGLNVDANMDTGSDADAKAINDQVTTQLADAKKMPQVMMLGFGALFDGLKTDSKGPTFHIAMAYNQQVVDDMVGRVQGLLKSFGGGMGGGNMGGPPPGMGGPGMGGPPPGMGMGGPPPGMMVPPSGGTPGAPGGMVPPGKMGGTLTPPVKP